MRSTVLLACVAIVIPASSYKTEYREDSFDDDLALLQRETSPRFEGLQASDASRITSCAQRYFARLKSVNLTGEHRPWNLRRLPTSSRRLVISAGMGTTGTHSLVAALEKIGLHGYHYKSTRASANEHASQRELPHFIAGIVRKLRARPAECYDAISQFDFSKLPQKVDYVSDTPFTEMFLDVYTQFPHSKVVLTTRRSLEWARRRKEHLNVIAPVLRPCGLAFVEKYTAKDLAFLLEAYNDLVRCAVPKQNLLEVNLFTGSRNLTRVVEAFLGGPPHLPQAGGSHHVRRMKWPRVGQAKAHKQLKQPRVGRRGAASVQ